MEDFDPVILGVFRHPEADHYQITGPRILLIVKGVSQHLLEGPNKTVYSLHDGKTPCLVLVAPQMYCSFVATADRENGFIELKSDCLRIGRVGYVELREGNHWIELPCALPLSPTETASLLDEFKALQAAWSVPIPSNLFKVKAGIIGLLRFFIDQTVSTQKATLAPAQKFRQLIDADKKIERNLAELSRQCNYSSEHMRKIFREQYQVSPQEYRHLQRMRRAMHLIASTELTLSEIAEQTGFRHLTHFYAAFKRTFHLTPLQGIRQFRGKPPRMLPTTRI